jgi:myo-inositol 2-dehydrogenase/D-chiro-inositol 1-dehydrogenase
MPVTIDGSRHDPRGYDARIELLVSEDAVSVGPAVLPGSFAERFAGAFAAETQAFLGLVRDGGESPCPPESALEALRVAVACDRSRAEGRAVAMSEIE